MLNGYGGNFLIGKDYYGERHFKGNVGEKVKV
jgi:hypothetical protein